MILELIPETPVELVEKFCVTFHCRHVHIQYKHFIVSSSKSTLDFSLISPYVKQRINTNSDLQLASLGFSPKTGFQIEDITVGNGSNMFVAAGPCSVESHEQANETALFLKSQGIRFFRAGSFKPRTSPYGFQGLEEKGLEILKTIKQEHDLLLISEAKDATNVDQVLKYADVLQIGTKAMYDQGILKAAGKSGKPVLLKRGFGSTLQEFVQAAEFILCEGNERVILCERGIRTFETATRFTLDLCGVEWLKAHTRLPVVVDPSHAMGYSYGVTGLSRASAALGVDGLLIEVHPSPYGALSDSSQQLDFDSFKKLKAQISSIANTMSVSVI
ncbi:MAG: 3-deoxy-7-phosphoheptulonate synthase [Flavobacteriales bacterium]